MKFIINVCSLLIICVFCLGHGSAQEVRYGFCYTYKPNDHTFYSNTFSIGGSATEQEVSQSFERFIAVKYRDIAFVQVGCTFTTYNGMSLTSSAAAEQRRQEFAKSRGEGENIINWTYDPNSRYGGVIVRAFSGTGGDQESALAAAKELAQHSEGSDLASFGPHTCSEPPHRTPAWFCTVDVNTNSSGIVARTLTQTAKASGKSQAEAEANVKELAFHSAHSIASWSPSCHQYANRAIPWSCSLDYVVNYLRQ